MCKDGDKHQSKSNTYARNESFRAKCVESTNCKLAKTDTNFVKTPVSNISGPVCEVSAVYTVIVYLHCPPQTANIQAKFKIL